MSEGKKRFVYIIESDDGVETSNYSTGTKLYERFKNALNRLKAAHRRDNVVVEYELVRTGNVTRNVGGNFVTEREVR